jgi:hypothetical protein
MPNEFSICRGIKCAHGDRCPVFLDRVPKERRAARGTEASSHFFSVEPRYIADAINRYSGAGNVCGCFKMTRMFSALRTVTCTGWRKITTNLKTYCSAKTGSFVHSLPLTFNRIYQLNTVLHESPSMVKI